MPRHACPLRLSCPAPRDEAFQPRTLGRVGDSPVPCWGTAPRGMPRQRQESPGAAFPSLLPCAARWPGMTHKPVVPYATWPCPSRNKAPYLFTHGARAVSQQPPPPSLPSPPESGGGMYSLHASPWLSCLGTTVSLRHSRASRCSLPESAAPSSPHQGFISGEGCAPRWSRQLSPGSSRSLGVLDESG